MKSPPPTEIPLIHKINQLYQNLYLLSRQISKCDRFGIYSKIEQICLDLLELIITAALEERTNKIKILNSSRIKTEVLKRLIRDAAELHIIEQKQYLILENDLQEVSKMINGWIKYLK